MYQTHTSERWPRTRSRGLCLRHRETYTCMTPQRCETSALYPRSNYMLIGSFSTENKTRIIKMTSLDGEYMLLGRKSEDVTNIFVQYGQGATRTVNVTGGNNFQEAEFVDGLRLRVQSAKPFTLNADISNGVDEATIPENSISLSMKSRLCILSS